MAKSSRRHFLAVTGVGAAAVGVATVIPASLAGAASPADPRIDGADVIEAPLADSVLMACVTDLSTGELTVINGANEITLTDRSLVQRIVQHTGKVA